MTANKTPTGDFIKLNRRDYQIILDVFDSVKQGEGITLSTGEILAGLDEEELIVRHKIQQILVNIQKFNSARRIETHSQSGQRAPK